MAKIKEQISRTKQKLKRFGFGTALAAAAALPLKAGAQSERVVDPETYKLSVVLDTIRLGITVKNTSSPKKYMLFLNVSASIPYDKKDSVINDTKISRVYNIPTDGLDNKYWAWPYTEYDKNGPFLLMLKNAIVKKDGNHYEYNTDAIYDNYVNLGKKYFPALHKKKNNDCKIIVCYTKFIEQVVFCDKENSGILLGNMIIDNQTRNVIAAEIPSYANTENSVGLFVYQNIADKENEVRFYNNGNEEIWRKDSKGKIVTRKVIDSKNIEQNILNKKAKQR